MTWKDSLRGPKGDVGPRGEAGPKGGFWSAKRIKEAHAEAPLFWVPGDSPQYSPPAPMPDLVQAQLRGSSYSLLMGSEAYVTPVEDSDPKSVQRLEPGAAFRIPPGQFAFLLTHEAVHVPNNAIGLLALRARALKFKGLVNVSGFHIDPGYKGRLVLAVYNAGPGEIHLKQGRPLFEVFFADLDQATEAYEPSSGVSEIYSIETSDISAIAGKFETLSGLKNKIETVESDLQERIHSLEREQSVTRWAAALILAFLIAFGVRECAPQAASATPINREGAVHG